MTIKKTLLAIAISATVAAPAALAQSSVQIYGKLFPFIVNEKGSDATPVGTPVATFAANPTGTNAIGGTTGMASGSSRIGFRGQEDLGGGLKAIFQLEGATPVDTGAATLFERDTYVGLDGSFGTVKLGKMRTVFREAGAPISMLGNSAGTFMSNLDLLRKTGFGTSSASSFHLRRSNSIQYTSPKISDFQARVQYSTDEAKTATRDPRVISMAVEYDKGPFYVALAHEIHYDLFGGSRNVPSSMRNNGITDAKLANSTDKATELTVEWRLNKQHKFAFDVIRKEYKENATVAGRFGSYKNTAYMLGMENRWSEQWRTTANYVTAGAGTCTRIAAACLTDGLDGAKVVLGAGYVLSKRTMLFGAYSRLMNGKSARYDSAELGGPPNPGEAITQYALGLSHSF